MRILIVENEEQIREDLHKRVEGAARQTSLKAVQIDSVALKNAGGTPPDIIFLGPTTKDALHDTSRRLQSIFPDSSLALLLTSEAYLEHSVEIHRRNHIRVIASGDLPQIAQIILEASSQATAQSHASSGGGVVISVCHVRGGVGATSITSSLGAALSERHANTTILDFNHVSQDVTHWSAFTLEGKVAVEKALNLDSPSKDLCKSLIEPVHEYSHLSVVGQPETYISSFRMSLNRDDIYEVEEDWTETIISMISEETDVVLVDLGNHWGPAHLSTLASSNHVLLVSDSEDWSVSRTIDFIGKIAGESGDPAEFNFNRWTLVVNNSDSDNELDSAKEKLQSLFEIFEQPIDAYSIPLSKKGSDWMSSQNTLFENGDKSFQTAIDHLADKITPFKKK